MLTAQVLTSNSVFDPFLKTDDFQEIEKMETSYYLKPDDQIIDYHINNLKKITGLLGTIEVLSDEDRVEIKKLATHFFKAFARVEQDLIYVKGLPEHVPWKQKACDKLEELVILLEDLGEICALSASTEFTQMIEAEIRSFSDESLEN
ncbi:MAG: hypothetical protein F4246_03700 [Rhodothermaceae bacterium]|nr:hypothetical protein [Rhodothermaceae bacterium]MYD56100.1 hypothetical protein [Rhodothermaceae bacterium]